MSEAAKLFLNVKTNLTIEFKNQEYLSEQKFVINDSNVNNEQQKRLKSIPQLIILRANGDGIAFAGVSCEYSLKFIGKTEKNYEVSVGVDFSHNRKEVTVYVNTRARASEIDANVKGMTLVEIELLSGYIFLNESNIYNDLKKHGVKVKCK